MASKAYHLVIEAGYGTKYENNIMITARLQIQKNVLLRGMKNTGVGWGLCVGEEGLPAEMCFKTGVKGDSRLNW